MTEENTNTQVVDTPEKKSGISPKTTLLLIVAVALIPMVAAYTAFFTGIGVPDNTVNNGSLIKAMSLEPLLSEDEWQRLQDEKKWRLFLPLGQTCNQSCQDNFYTTRQVHVRLGEKGLRVERYALNYGGSAGQRYLDDIKGDHPVLQAATVDSSIWENWSETLAEFTAQTESHFYLLVDQEGFAMMVYTDQHGNDLLKDIKRALKYSIDYQ